MYFISTFTCQKNIEYFPMFCITRNSAGTNLNSLVRKGPKRIQSFRVFQAFNFQSCASLLQTSSSSSNDNGKLSSVIDGLDASSRWKRDQLNKITDKFMEDSDLRKQPLQIKSDDEVQPMWREMESRVLRRKSVTMAEALTKGMKTGRRNIRNTDEDIWMDAGLYRSGNHSEK
jgi:hypothetical protein